MIRRRRQPGRFEKCRVAVRADHGSRVGRAGLNLARPANDPRNADAAFVEHSFEATKRTVVAVVAAIVGLENNQRVLPQTGFVKRLEKASDRGVHVFDHRGIDRIFDGRALAIFGDDLLARLHRVMHGKRPPIQEERAFAVRADKCDGFVGEPLRKVFRSLAIHERRDAIRRKVAWRSAARVPADVEIKTLLLRAQVIFRDSRFTTHRVGEMPLADVRGGVAGRREPLGDGDSRERQMADILGLLQGRVLQRKADRISGRVVGDPQSCRRLPGHHRSTRRRANRGGGISIDEAHAFCGQLIQRWRVHLRVAVTVEIPPAKIVRHDDDDIGLPGCGANERQGEDEDGEDVH